METFIQDLRETLRSLSKSPTFALATILTMTLGLGVNTAMFSVLHAVLLKPLPYPDPDGLTFIWSDLVDAHFNRRPLSGPELADLRAGAKRHESIGAVWATAATLVDQGRPEPLRVAMVTSNFLSILGVSPVRGRLFEPREEGQGAPPAVVISGELWQSRFGGADVIGRRIQIDGGWGMISGDFTIVGVMPVGFEMLLPADSSVPPTVDVWVPFWRDLESSPRLSASLRTIGRLRPGTTMAEGQDEIENLGREMVRQHAEYGKAARRFYAEPLRADVVRDARPALLVLQAAVGLVLLIACANVASLLLVRAQTRRTETSVRLALGASRGRLAQLHLIESLLLAGAGGICGLALALLALRFLPLLDAGSLPRSGEIAINLPVLGVSLLASVGAGLLFGLAPLIASWRVDVVTALKASGRGSRGTAMPRGRSLLVLAEIGLGVMLLIGAGLLVRTFVNLYAVNPGYRADQVLTFTLSLPFDRYGNPAALSRFTRALEQALNTIPGVQSAGAVNQLPLDNVPNWTTVYWTRANASSKERAETDARLVTPGYFGALQASLVAGRWITARDDETQPLALIVDERFARQVWPQGNAVGQELGIQVSTSNGPAQRWGTVVGVVRHMRHHRVSEEVREELFIPFAQAPRAQMGVVVRSAIDPQSLVRSISTQLATIDPNLVPARVRPLEDFVAHSRASARFSMVLVTVFAGFSLLLACVGLYGVIAYSVAQRTSELGVRAALGARASDLVTLVVAQGAKLVAAGIVLGVGASLLLAGSIKSLLFGISAFDAVTFIGVPLVLAGMALLACYVAARRAARIDPANALRSQ